MIQNLKLSVCGGVSRSIQVLVQMYMYVLLVKEDVFSWEWP